MAQVERARDAHDHHDVKCIAVNDTYLVAPWADVQYAADAAWHRWHTEGIAKPVLGLTAQEVRDRWASFAGVKCSIQDSGGAELDELVHIMRNRDHPARGRGLSLDPQMLVTGHNSGFQALNLAVLAGSKRIILLGFDGAPGRDGRDHFHGGHPRATSREAYSYYRQAMSAAENALIAAGVEVINCSPGSAIDSFPKRALEDVL